MNFVRSINEQRKKVKNVINNTNKTKKLCDRLSIVSGILHLWGFILSIAGTVVLIVFTALEGADPWKIVSFSIYGASVIALYGASSAYHVFYISEKVHRRLRKLDHCMIYLLIAGSYTPLCIVTLRETIGWAMLAVIWSLTIVGIIVKIIWIDAPAYVSAFCYVVVGWAIIAAFNPLKKMLGTGGVGWLVTAGILYTVGALIYGIKALKFETLYFGSHELFHLFVLAGSACYFNLLFQYIK